MTVFGYARISTTDQNLANQVAMLREAGCEKIYKEQFTGASVDRKELNSLIKKLMPGDTLVVCRLDRLARNLREVLNLLHELSGRGVGFKSLHETMIDTTSPHGKLILNILAALAEFERELIKARCDEGRKRAVERGVKLGRKPKLSTYQRQELLNRLSAGETQSALALSYKISQSTIS